VRRHLPDRAFPAYAFVPGEQPHPTRDPRGHSHDHPPEPLSTAFHWGVDLYNHGYLWEAHEAWEGLWQAAESGSAEAAFVQGLIQCAAAGVKLQSGRPDAARRIGERALAHLERALEGGAPTRGLDLQHFIARLRAWIEAGPGPVDDRPPIEL
jgi:predicted metal-dependent hydrolase